jgi:hypothetical protein
MADKRLPRQTRERHGMSYTRTYSQWKGMLQRCENPKHESYPNYGGRGIVVCEEWHSFSKFLEDMGECPPSLYIERKDNDGPYCKANCVWDTKKAEARNSRGNVQITCQGRTQPRIAWAEERQINENTIRHRLKVGWSVEQALEFEPAPVIQKTRGEVVRREWNGQLLTLKQLSEICGKHPATLFQEHKRGWSTERMMQREVGPDSGDIYTINGKTQNIAAHCKELGLNKTTVGWRLANGWSPERAFSTDDGRQGENNRKRRRCITHDGITLTEKEWCDRLGISYAAFLQRCHRGIDRKEALGL